MNIIFVYNHMAPDSKKSEEREKCKNSNESFVFLTASYFLNSQGKSVFGLSVHFHAIYFLLFNVDVFNNNRFDSGVCRNCCDQGFSDGEQLLEGVNVNEFLFNVLFDLKNTFKFNADVQNVRLLFVQNLNAERCFAGGIRRISDVVGNGVAETELNRSVDDVVEFYSADFIGFELNVAHFLFIPLLKYS